MGQLSGGFWLFDLFHDLDFDFGGSGLNHFESFGRPERKVQHTVFDKRTPVVDLAFQAESISQMGYPDDCSKRENAVGGTDAVHIEDFAAGGRPAVKLVCVVRSYAYLIRTFGGDRL
tara:strand:- start:5336 stop:5686 length:351 start_codon:yes stop_codon:yes gene_type:complete